MLYQIGNIGIGVGHITRLQWQHFHFRLPAKRFLKCGDVIHQFDRAVVANVIDTPGSHAGARIRACPTPDRIRPGRLIQYADNAFHDVADIGEIPAMLAMVENRDFLSGQDGLGKFK